MLISRDAISPFFASTAVLLVSADVFAEMAGEFPATLVTFQFAADGTISLHDGEPAGTHMELSGVANHCPAVITSERLRPAGDMLVNFWREAGAHVVPELIQVSGTKPADKARLFSKLAKAIADRQLAIIQALALEAKKVEHLRRKNEWLSLQVRRAEDFLQDLGRSEVLLMQLPATGTTLGPGGDIDCRSCSMRLPHDMVGISRFQLSMATFAGAPKGDLRMLLERTADRKPIAAWCVPFDAVQPGWMSFVLPKLTHDLHGDCVLHLNWDGEEQDGAPLVHVSSYYANRFGLSRLTGATLAWTSWRRLVDGEPVDGIAPVAAPDDRLVPHFVSLADMASQPQFAFGEEEAKRIGENAGFYLWGPAVNRGAVRTHPVLGELIALAVPLALPQGSRLVTATVHTAHGDAPEVEYALVAASEALAASRERLEGLIDQAARGGGSIATADAVVGISVVPADTRHAFTIEIPPDSDSITNLVLAVRPVGGTVANAWAEWCELRVLVEPQNAIVLPLKDLRNTSAPETALPALPTEPALAAVNPAEAAPMPESFAGLSLKPERSEIPLGSLVIETDGAVECFEDGKLDSIKLLFSGRGRCGLSWTSQDGRPLAQCIFLVKERASVMHGFHEAPAGFPGDPQPRLTASAIAEGSEHILALDGLSEDGLFEAAVTFERPVREFSLMLASLDDPSDFEVEIVHCLAVFEADGGQG